MQTKQKSWLMFMQQFTTSLWQNNQDVGLVVAVHHLPMAEQLGCGTCCSSSPPPYGRTIRVWDLMQQFTTSLWQNNQGVDLLLVIISKLYLSTQQHADSTCFSNILCCRERCSTCVITTCGRLYISPPVRGITTR